MKTSRLALLFLSAILITQFSFAQSVFFDQYKSLRDSLNLIALNEALYTNMPSYNKSTGEVNYFFTIRGEDNMGANQERRFGVHTQATFCIDNSLGEWSLPPDPPPGVFEMRWTDPRGYYDNECFGLGTYLDLRPHLNRTQVDSFILRFQLSGEDPSPTSPFTLSWTGELGRFCDSMILKYPGGLVNMFSTNSHQIVIPIRSVKIIKWGAKDTTGGTIPPSSLKLLNVSTQKMDLEWVDNSADELGFYIHKSTDGVQFTLVDSVSPNVNSYIGIHTRNLQPGTRYWWGVNSYNASGRSVCIFADTITKNNYITGKVFIDNNENSVLDDNEHGVSGRTVFLTGSINLITQTDGSGNYLFSRLPDGEYFVSQEEIQDWKRTIPTPDSFYNVVLVEGQASVGKDFGNFKLAHISGYVWRDNNRNGNKDFEESYFPGTSIKLEAQNISNNQITSTDNDGKFEFLASSDNYILKLNPPASYYQTNPSISTPYFVTVDNSGFEFEDKNFGINTVIDSVKFTSFCYDSIAALVNGKIQKIVKKKPIGAYWEYAVVNTGNVAVSVVHVEFSNEVKSFAHYSPFTVYGGEKKKFYFTAGTLSPGDTFCVKGYSLKGKAQVIKKCWLGPITGTPQKNIIAKYQYLELPMPNYANIIDEIFKEANYASTGLLIGEVPQNPNSAGWVRILKSSNAIKSIRDKSGPHTGVPSFFFGYGGKQFTKEKNICPPSKHNNKLFAEVLTLKLNIAASQLGKTQHGFCDLIYYNPTNILNGYSIDSIAKKADRFLSFVSGNANDYYEVIRSINNAFAGPLDTVSFSSRIVVKENKYLTDVPYLLAPKDGKVTRIKSVVETHEYAPTSFEMYQNYPNPFNPSTIIEFSIPEDAFVTIKVYNLLGQVVGTLLDKELVTSGMNEITFESGDLSTGIYFYSITAEGTDENFSVYRSVKKMLLLR